MVVPFHVGSVVVGVPDHVVISTVESGKVGTEPVLVGTALVVEAGGVEVSSDEVSEEAVGPRAVVGGDVVLTDSSVSVVATTLLV